LQDIPTILAGHQHVEQDEVRHAPGDERLSLISALSHLKHIVLSLQVSLVQADRVPIVINDQDRLGFDRPYCEAEHRAALLILLQPEPTSIYAQ